MTLPAGISLALEKASKNAMEGGERRPRGVCGSEYAYGPEHYELRRNATYDILVCAQCHHRNAAGWARELENRILTRLRESGKREPRRLQNGLLPYH